MSVHAVFPGEALILYKGVRRQGVNGNIRRVGPRQSPNRPGSGASAHHRQG